MLYNPKEGRCAYMDNRFCKPNEEIFIEKFVGNIESLTRNERLRKDKSKVSIHIQKCVILKNFQNNFFRLCVILQAGPSTGKAMVNLSQKI